MSSVFGEVAQQSYVNFLKLQETEQTTVASEGSEEAFAIERAIAAAGLQTIVFAAMTFEAAIYDYAAVHLGDKYVKDHIDKLDVVSKWVLCLRLISGYEFRKGEQPFAALQRLVTARNRLVHSKSEPADFSDLPRQIAKLEAESETLTQDVHNAFRALVLMAFEMECNVATTAVFLRSYDPAICVSLDLPSILQPIVSECRRIIYKK